MQLIEILLPLRGNDGRPFAPELWAFVRETLVDRFGGLTAFNRAPAEGLWEPEEGARSRDEIVLLEVMAEALERGWWADFRRELERRFAQEEVVIRARTVERL
jgi:hypothetical protein